MHFFVSSFNGKWRYAALIKNLYNFHLTKYSIGLTSPKAAASTPFYKFPRMIRLENLAFNEIQIGNIWNLKLLLDIELFMTARLCLVFTIFIIVLMIVFSRVISHHQQIFSKSCSPSTFGPSIWNQKLSKPIISFNLTCNFQAHWV